MSENPEAWLFDVACPQCGVEFVIRRGDAKTFSTRVDIDGVAEVEVEVVYVALHLCQKVGLR